MKKLDWFVIKSFFWPLIMTFFIVLFIQIMQFLWMYVDDMAGKGLELNILMELLFQFSLVFVPTALPLGILFASLMTFGNMGENFELTAIKSSGIPLQRVMKPLIVLIVFISIGSFFFANNVLPYSNRKARTLMYDIQRKRPELNIQAGSFYNGIEGFSMKIGSKDPLTNKLEKILIYDHRGDDGNTSVIMADSGYMRMTPDETALLFNLYNGYSYNDIKENVPMKQKRYPFRSDHFASYTFLIELSGFDLNRSDMDIFRNHQAMQDISQLNYFIDSLSTKLENKTESYLSEYKNTKLYKRRNYNPDGLLKAENPANVVFDVDSIFNAVTDQDKSIAISQALINAREGIKFVGEKQVTLHRDLKGLNKYKIELHEKLTLAVACLVFFFIGAPLGAIIRRGGLGMPAVISVLFFVVYYVLSLLGKKMAEEGIASAGMGMWGSTFILFVIGVFLTYKATSDSVIMNTETYSLFFKKLLRPGLIIKNKKQKEEPANS